MTEHVAITIDVLPYRLERISLSNLKRGDFVEIVKLREDLALLYDFFLGVKPPDGDDGSVERSIELSKAIIVQMQAAIAAITICGGIPQRMADSGHLLFDSLNLLASRIRYVGYFAFPHAVGYIEGALLTE